MSSNDAPYRRVPLFFRIRRRDLYSSQRSVWKSELPSAISTHFLPVGPHFQPVIGREDEQVSSLSLYIKSADNVWYTRS